MGTTILTFTLWPLNKEWWWQHSQFLRCFWKKWEKIELRLYGLMKKKLILIFSKISFTSSFFQYQAASQMNLVWWLTFLSANSCKNKNKYYKNVNLKILHINIKQELCSYFLMLPYNYSLFIRKFRLWTSHGLVRYAMS